MIDIATTSPPNTHSSITSMPFDWVLLAAPANAQAWHDHTNLCVGATHRVDDLPNTYAYALEAGLHTSVIHSLFTDARAGRDDKLPYNATDRRGWVGEQFIPKQVGDTSEYGSRLWLNYYVPATEEVLEAQRFAAYESLSWLVGTGVVDSVEVTAEYRTQETSELLALHIVMRRDGEKEPIYDAVWGATLGNPEGDINAT
jgi:phage gp46-like protein